MDQILKSGDKRDIMFDFKTVGHFGKEVNSSAFWATGSVGAGDLWSAQLIFMFTVGSEVVKILIRASRCVQIHCLFSCFAGSLARAGKYWGLLQILDEEVCL